MLRGVPKPSSPRSWRARRKVSPCGLSRGVIKDNYTEEMRRTKKERAGKVSDLHWIGGVPVDVRQAGTGGLPREGLHHGQQKEE